MRTRTGWAAGGAALVLVVAGAVAADRLGSQDQVPPRQTVVQDRSGAQTIDLPGGPGLVLRPENADGRVVIYLHGKGGTEQSLQSGQLEPLVAALLERGFTVAAARAHGDAWGSPASVDSYVRLAEALEPTQLYLLPLSMGGLAGFAAVDALPEVDSLPDVTAVAAIYPVCDLSSVYEDGRFTQDIRRAREADLEQALQEGPLVPQRSEGLDVLIWASPEDTLVPKQANADRCAGLLREAGANVQVVEARGEHRDPSHFDAERLVQFYESAS